MADEPKSVSINLRIRPSLKAALERAAKAEHRSMTNLIEKLLEDHIAAQKAKR